MDANEFKKILAKYRKETEPNLKDLARWGETTAIPWIWAELSGILQKPCSALKPQDAIRQGLQVTYADRRKKPFEPKYYIAQVTMLEAEAARYRSAVATFDATIAYAPNATIYALHNALHRALHDGLILLEQCAHALIDVPTFYGSWRAQFEHSFQVYKGAEQAIYGRFSGLTHDDVAPYVPVAALRTAIEIRLRSAFGVQGYRDPTNDNFIPIDVSEIFEQLKPRLSSIEFAVDLHDVFRVYKWCNSYLHAGWRDFVWVSGYCVQFLRPLFADDKKTPTGAWSISGGVRMRRSTWRDIRGAFDPSGSTSKTCLARDIVDAIGRTVSRRRKDKRLELNEADETAAECVFLD